MEKKRFEFSYEGKKVYREVLSKHSKSELIDYLIHMKEVCENFFLENVDLKVKISSLENKLQQKNKQK